MLPVFALVGRPNVGKSTLFNNLTRSRAALVFDTPGITRDRLYAQGQFDDKPFLVIDTGGITGDEEGLDILTVQQSWQAVEEAQVILWMVDAQAGLTPADKELAKQLRQLKKPVLLVVNKTDNLTAATASSEFYSLGWPDIVNITAAHGRGIPELLEKAFAALPKPAEENVEIETPEESTRDPGIQVAVIGRPNVGKSTLVNRLLGEERVVVFDKPGTTRDSIFIPFTRRDQAYTLIDTAGVRRRQNVNETLEKFSVVKSMQAIAEADVVIFVLNAQESVTEQDLNLLGFVVESGRSLVIAINKWDGLTAYERSQIRAQVNRRLEFVNFAKMIFISARHGTGVGELWEAIQKAYRCATTSHPTNLLTTILHDAVTAHAPPISQGRRAKLKYAHMGGVKPPRIVIHGNLTDKISSQYKRYLIHTYQKALKLVGTPVQLIFKSGQNPYE